VAQRCILTLLDLVYVPVFVSSVVFVSVSPPIKAVWFGLNEQLLSRDFCLAVREENAALGRARKRGKVWDKMRGDQTKGRRKGGRGREGRRGREGEVGKTNCRLHLVDMGEGVPTVFKYLVCRIHQHEKKRLYPKRPKIAQECLLEAIKPG
jgi:hypothetical protein